MNKRHVLGLLFALIILSVVVYLFAGGKRPSPVQPPQAVRQSGDRTLDFASSTTSVTKSVGTAADARPSTSGADERVRGEFHKFQRCFANHQKYIYLTQAIDQCYASPNKKSNFVSCPKSMSDAQMDLAAVQDALSDCGDYKDIERANYEATRAAAKNEDRDAQMCYVASRFTDQEPGQPRFYTDKDVADYEETAPEYISEALSRGDWRVVEILSIGHLETAAVAFCL